MGSEHGRPRSQRGFFLGPCHQSQSGGTLYTGVGSEVDGHQNYVQMGVMAGLYSHVVKVTSKPQPPQPQNNHNNHNKHNNKVFCSQRFSPFSV